MDREKDLKLWSIKKWQSVTPPMRPSQEEMASFEKALIDSGLKEGAEALILGATPELRSLTLKLKLKTTGCDIDKEFWEAMTFLRTFEGAEEFIHGNWLDLDEDRQYDFILADCSLTMLSWEEIQILVPKLRSLLKDGGLSIQRILNANPNLDLDSISEAMDSYRKDNPGISLNLYLYFLAESLRNTLQPEMTTREFFEAFVFPRLKPEETDKLKPYLVDRKFSYPPREDLLTLIEESFVVVSEVKSSGPGLWDTAWIYVLKKKSQ